MRLPRLWRLFSEPAPRTTWLGADGRTECVWYVEGIPGDRWVVTTPPAGSTLWIAGRRRPLAAWRRWWLTAREVPR